MRCFKPRGLRIHRYICRRYLSLGGGRGVERFACTVKSTGRTGAAVRAAFVRQPEHVQQRILADWAKGHAAEIAA